MNKFSDPEDEDFLLVKDVIEGMVNEAPSQILQRSHRVCQSIRTYMGRPIMNPDIEGISRHRMTFTSLGKRGLLVNSKLYDLLRAWEPIYAFSFSNAELADAGYFCARCPGFVL